MKTLGMEDKNWTEKEFKNYGEFCVKTSGRHGECDKITVCPRFKKKLKITEMEMKLISNLLENKNKIALAFLVYNHDCARDLVQFCAKG